VTVRLATSVLQFAQPSVLAEMEMIAQISWRGPPRPECDIVKAITTTPFVDVRYEVVGYRSGPVGMLQVLRDPKKLPYRVRKSVGGQNKQIREGQVFVRHGSQTEEPTPLELQEIELQGDRARTAS
jgi:hypothetical protein